MDFTKPELKLIRVGVKVKRGLTRNSRICIGYTAWALKAAKSLHKKGACSKPVVDSSLGCKSIMCYHVSSKVVGAALKMRKLGSMATAIEAKKGYVIELCTNKFFFKQGYCLRKITKSEYEILKGIK